METGTLTGTLVEGKQQEKQPAAMQDGSQKEPVAQDAANGSWPWLTLRLSASTFDEGDGSGGGTGLPSFPTAFPEGEGSTSLGNSRGGASAICGSGRSAV